MYLFLINRHHHFGSQTKAVLKQQTLCRINKLLHNKDVLSRYVYQMYEPIDFDRFIPLLNAFDSIVSGSKVEEDATV